MYDFDSTIDRCEQCSLYNAVNEAECPSCGRTMYMKIEGLSLSWSCPSCGYGLATTAPKLCVWDDGMLPAERYGKRGECPYAEIKENKK